MPAVLNFTSIRYADSVLTIDMTPTVAVGGWDVEFYLTKWKGGVNKLVSKVSASGYATGQSGITVLDSGIGRYQVAITNLDKSGLDFGNYFASFNRTTSGLADVLAEGYISFK